MKRYGKQVIVVSGAVLLCAAVLLSAVWRLQKTAEISAPAFISRPVVTVDAGHGDFDGGAVAPDGTQEKHINLAIARPLADILTLMGYDVVQTRIDDHSVYDADALTVREKKVSDMKRRLGLFDAADLNISIHQNMFGAARYHGAQMFYAAANPLSKPLAECVREQVCEQLQPDNTRSLKSGSKDIYLLYKTVKPTVLVECGFLSNAEELARLKDATYQQRMAFAIACGTLSYTRQYGSKGG